MSSDLTIQNKTPSSIVTTASNAPFTTVPQEIVLEILRLLKPAELGNVACVNKTWNALASNESLWDINHFFPNLRIFDLKEWHYYFNLEKSGIDLTHVPPLNRKTILTLFPIIRKAFNSVQTEEQPTALTLLLLPEGHSTPLLEKFAGSPKHGHPTCFDQITDVVEQEFVQMKVKTTQRVLISTLLNGSKDLSFNEQKNLVEQAGCEIPDALTVATHYMTTYVSSKETSPKYLPAAEDYTRCAINDPFNEPNYYITVGGAGERGLNVIHNVYDEGDTGMVAMRVLKEYPSSVS